MVWSESGEKSAQIKHRLQVKTVQNSSKQICGWILMWETTGDGLFHWRKRFYGLWTRILVRSDGFKLKKSLNDGFFSYKHADFSFTRCELMDWSGVDYLWIIVMFLSAVWTLILTAPIHCRGSTGEKVMQCYISPNLMKKQTHLSWMSWGWAHFQHIYFWLNYSL